MPNLMSSLKTQLFLRRRKEITIIKRKLFKTPGRLFNLSKKNKSKRTLTFLTSGNKFWNWRIKTSMKKASNFYYKWMMISTS